MNFKNMFLFIALYIIVMIIRSQVKARKHKSIMGYIVMEGNTVHIYEKEFVRYNEIERIAELGLDQSDMKNGLAVVDVPQNKKSFELADDVLYSFRDFDIESKEMKVHTTREKDRFIKHLGDTNKTPLNEQKIPYLIEMKNLKVMSIEEKPEYSI